MALKGNFDIYKNLMINLESMRPIVGQVFESSSVLASCPKPDFKIPDVGMSIEKDSRYVRYNEVVKTIQTLIPEIETNFRELQKVQEKKKKDRTKDERD